MQSERVDALESPVVATAKLNGYSVKETMSKRQRQNGSATPRQSRGSGDKRERILSAAVRVFANKGFYATRVSEIAEAAGVADGTIYLYFKNKDHVLVSIFEDRLDALIALLEREIGATESVQEQIEKIVYLQLHLLESERDLAEVITINLRQSSRLLKEYAAPKFRRYLEIIAEVIAAGQSQGAFREELHPFDAARALWGSLDGVLMTWALGEAKPAALRRASTAVASIFLRGLAADQPEP
jgi:TetR/AcrR family fatty acid metabolism transcriptional regulator